LTPDLLALHWEIQDTGYIKMMYSGHDRMVVGFTTTCAISAYYH